MKIKESPGGSGKTYGLEITSESAFEGSVRPWRAQEAILLSYQVSRLINIGAGTLNWSIDKRKGKIVIFGHATKASAASLCQQTGGQFCHGIGCNICPELPTLEDDEFYRVDYSKIRDTVAFYTSIYPDSSQQWANKLVEDGCIEGQIDLILILQRLIQAHLSINIMTEFVISFECHITTIARKLSRAIDVRNPVTLTK